MSPDRLISSAVLLTQSLLAVHAPAPSNRQGSDERTARTPGPARSMIIDLLLPPTIPGIKDPIVDLYGKPEILFMGPDENTADLVDWATEHARKRGAPWWPWPWRR